MENVVFLRNQVKEIVRKEVVINEDLRLSDELWQ